jgi:hypothetical protein
MSIKIVFSPGFFEEFTGSQEELDNLTAELQQLADSGELWKAATLINLDELDEIEESLLMSNVVPRTLH